MNRVKPTPANLLIMVGGAVMLIGSFLAFYKAPGQSVTAWSSGLFGIATVVVLCGAAMGGQVALSIYATGVSLPPKLFGLTWDQVHLALGFQAAIMMLAYLFLNHGIASFGIGFWMMLISAIALFAGAIMRANRHPHLRST